MAFTPHTSYRERERERDSARWSGMTSLMLLGRDMIDRVRSETLVVSLVSMLVSMSPSVYRLYASVYEPLSLPPSPARSHFTNDYHFIL